MKTTITLIITLLLCATITLWHKNQTLQADNQRLKSNVATLIDKATYYQTQAHKSAASVQKLQLTYTELQQHYRHICQTADDLNLKIKRLQAASTTATQTEVKIITQIRDSIIYHHDSAATIPPDSLKTFNWRDPWVDITGQIRGQDITLDLTSTDTITQIIHRVPKKFWFIKWGTKAIRQEIVSNNPHTKITYTEYIELKKH